MSWSAELKDFTESYKTGSDIREKRDEQKSRNLLRESQMRNLDAESRYNDRRGADSAAAAFKSGVADMGSSASAKISAGNTSNVKGLGGGFGSGEADTPEHGGILPSTPDPRNPKTSMPTDPEGMLYDQTIAAALKNGGVVPAYFKGGLVGDTPVYADPAVSEEDPAEPEPDADVDDEAIPTSRPQMAALPPPTEGMGAGAPAPAAPAAAPQADEDNKPDDLLGVALHGGLMTLTKMFNLGSKPAAAAPAGAIPDGSPAPAAPAADPGGRFMMNGIGASSKEQYDSVMHVIDPKGQLDENIRNIAGIKGVYDYYLKKGDIEKANMAAASLIQYSRNTSAIYAGKAEEALKAGNFKDGLALAVKSYDAVPDGMSIKVAGGEKGSGKVEQFDANGQKIGEMMFTPEKLLGAVVGLKNGSLFYQQLMQSAVKYLGPEPNKAAEAFYERESKLLVDDSLNVGGEAVPTGSGASAPAAAAPAGPMGASGSSGAAAPAGGSPVTTAPAPGAPGAPAPVAPAPVAPAPVQGAIPETAGVPQEQSQTAMVMGAEPGAPVAPPPLPTPPPAPTGMMREDPAIVQEYVRKGDKNGLNAYRQYLITHNQAKKNEYSAKVQDYNTKMTEHKALVKEMGNGIQGSVKPEARPGISTALQTYFQGQVLPSLVDKDGKPTVPEHVVNAMQSGAYDLMTSNNIDPPRAVNVMRSLLTVDENEPTKLNFQARPIPGGVAIQTSDGAVVNVPANTFNQIAAIRGRAMREALKKQQTGLQKDVNMSKAYTAWRAGSDAVVNAGKSAVKALGRGAEVAADAEAQTNQAVREAPGRAAGAIADTARSATESMGRGIAASTDKDMEVNSAVRGAAGRAATSVMSAGADARANELREYGNTLRAAPGAAGDAANRVSNVLGQSGRDEAGSAIAEGAALGRAVKSAVTSAGNTAASVAKGTARGVKVVGRGLAKDAKAIGLGAVEGSKAVGSAVAKGAKDIATAKTKGTAGDAVSRVGSAAASAVGSVGSKGKAVVSKILSTAQKNRDARMRDGNDNAPKPVTDRNKQRAGRQELGRGIAADLTGLSKATQRRVRELTEAIDTELNTTTVKVPSWQQRK